MSGENASTWKELYHAALLEVDPAKLSMRLEEAFRSIEHRMHEVLQQGMRSHPEYADLLDAQHNLRVLRREIP